MIEDRIEAGWIDAFDEVFQLCKISAGESVVILSESQSRALNVHLAELALARGKAQFYHLKVPTPPAGGPGIVRSTGACVALEGQDKAVAALCEADVIIDLSVEGLMHAPQTADILKAKTRILNISNEHPEALARLVPDAAFKDEVRAAARRCRGAKRMSVSSVAGSALDVDMAGAATVGVWGWTDKPGTLAHWPGGIVVSFPASGAVNGRLVFEPGDMNLTFKRYFESRVTFDIAGDYVTHIDGAGADARLMRAYFEAFGDKAAYATSHVGWGLNPGARYEALAMYGRRDTNCTELRAVAGNFLYSTGANEFAGRFTRCHFDLPMMNCTIALDGETVVDEGRLVT